jgi:hypothetical protein
VLNRVSAQDGSNRTVIEFRHFGVKSLLDAAGEDVRKEITASGRDPEALVSVVDAAIVSARAESARAKLERARAELSAWRTKSGPASPLEREAARTRFERLTETLVSKVLGNFASIAIKGRGMPAVAAAKYLLSCRAAYKEHSSLDIGTGEDLTGLLKRCGDAWARLQCHPPMRASDQEWRQVIDDAGRFLDQWGSRAVEFGWTAGYLFDVPRDGKPGGLVWFLGGESVQAIGPGSMVTQDGRIFNRFENNQGKPKVPGGTNEN